MKKALVQYSHGLGDVILLTPHLRYLYDIGYIVDLMCRTEVRTSHLLDNCPYVGELIEIGNPWTAKDFNQQVLDNYDKFVTISNNYDWIGCSLHLTQLPREHKIDITSRELGLDITDKRVEVFLGEDDDVRELVEREYPDGYICVNSNVEFHTEHNWDARDWIRENLPELPVLELGRGGDFYRKWPDINKTFALLKHASYLVLNSSVFVHAADAMECEIEAINYGNHDRKMDCVNVEPRHIRRVGKWVK